MVGVYRKDHLIGQIHSSGKLGNDLVEISRLYLENTGKLVNSAHKSRKWAFNLRLNK